MQTQALHAYLRWRNASARHRDALAAEHKERARIRSSAAYGMDLTETFARPAGADTADVSSMTDEDRRARMEQLPRELEARIGTLGGDQT